MDNSIDEAQELDGQYYTDQDADNSTESNDAAQADNGDIPAKFNSRDSYEKSYSSLEQKLSLQGNELGEMRRENAELKQMLETLVSQPQQRANAAPQYATPELQRALDMIDGHFKINESKGQMSKFEKEIASVKNQNSFNMFAVKHPEMSDDQKSKLWNLGMKLGEVDGTVDYNALYNEIIKPFIPTDPATVEAQKKAKGAPSKKSVGGTEKLTREAIAGMSDEEYLKRRDEILDLEKRGEL